MRRRNGWEKPFDPLQIATWILFPVLICGYYAFFVPVLVLETAIVCGAIYGITSFYVCLMAWKCGSVDPIDDNIVRAESESMGTSVPDSYAYCNVCSRYVERNSRHCRVCDKCVATFDHHCKWLNNCVGKKNYRYFLGLIASTLAMVAIQLGTGIYLVVYFARNSDNEADLRLADVYGCSGASSMNGCADNDYNFGRFAHLGIQIAYLAATAPAVFLILQLLLFHIRLCYEGITTYDYIVRSRKRRLQRLRRLASGSAASNQEEEDNILCDMLRCRKPNRAAQVPVPAASVQQEGCKEDEEQRVKNPLVERALRDPKSRSTRGFGKQLGDTYRESTTPREGKEEEAVAVEISEGN